MAVTYRDGRTWQEIGAAVAALGRVVSVEYPGYLNISHGYAAERAWNVGTANWTTWGADLIDVADGEALDGWDLSTVPLTGTVAEIAEAIVAAIKVLEAGGCPECFTGGAEAGHVCPMCGADAAEQGGE